MPVYAGEVGETKAILKLVTKSQPEMPCLRLLTDANLRTFSADVIITSPRNNNHIRWVGSQSCNYLEVYQVRAFHLLYSRKRNTTSMEIVTTMAPRVIPQIILKAMGVTQKKINQWPGPEGKVSLKKKPKNRRRRRKTKTNYRLFAGHKKPWPLEWCQKDGGKNIASN